MFFFFWNKWLSGVGFDLSYYEKQIIMFAIDLVTEENKQGKVSNSFISVRILCPLSSLFPMEISLKQTNLQILNMIYSYHVYEMSTTIFKSTRPN